MNPLSHFLPPRIRNTFGCGTAALCVCSAALYFSAGTVSAQSAGDLDTTFGKGGKVVDSNPDIRDGSSVFTDLAAQPDGKIVAGGYVYLTATNNIDLAVIRYNADGTRDTSFGSGGLATADINAVANGGIGEIGTGLAIQPDGKILLAGYTNRPSGNLRTYSFVVTRFNADGSLDTAFGTNGIVELRPGADIEHTYGGVSIALQPDGKFVIAGATTGRGNSFYGDFVLLRYNADGTVDNTFGGGLVQTHLLGAYSQAILHRVMLQPDGKIVACGQDNGGSNSTDGGAVFLRYNSDGSLDGSFGSGGSVIFDRSVRPASDPYYEAVTDVQIQANGKIIGAGQANDIEGENADKSFLVRLNADGSLDATFGTGGLVPTILQEGNRPVRLRQAADGKYLVGQPDPGHNGDFELARFNADGSVDQTFGVKQLGYVDTDFVGAQDVPRGMLLQADGKVVLGGYATIGYVDSQQATGGSFPALVRYLTADHPRFFAGGVGVGNGVYYLTFPSGNYFGYYGYLADQNYIYHFDLGYEYVFDAADANSGVYLYDFKSNGFFYTSPAFPFPYLYDFSLNSTVYYYPDPNNPGRYNTDGVRYFYEFATGQIISK